MKERETGRQSSIGSTGEEEEGGEGRPRHGWATLWFRGGREVKYTCMH